MQSVRDSSSSARGAFGQLPAKRARVAIEGSSSGVSQSAAAKQFPSLAGRVLNTESSADLKRRSGVTGNSDENRKTLLLQLRRPHYDAIKDRRKLWEARPLFDGPADKPSMTNLLSLAMLQFSQAELAQTIACA